MRASDGAAALETVGELDTPTNDVGSADIVEGAGPGTAILVLELQNVMLRAFTTSSGTESQETSTGFEVRGGT